MATTSTPTKRPAGGARRKKSLDAGTLLGMDQQALDALFRASSPGATPTGVGDGTVIAAPGTPAARLFAALLGLAWQGKVFYEPDHHLLNRILPVGLRAVRASVYRDQSWFDGEPAIILDYSKGLLLTRAIRDEIREVAPGLYLGIVYIGKLKTVNFVLRFAT